MDDPEFPPAGAGTVARSRGGRSCSMPTTAWATRSISSATRRWSGPGAAGWSWPAPRALARLLATCEGIDLVVVEGGSLPDFDVYAPLMSLPAIFGTDSASIPAIGPLPVGGPRARAIVGRVAACHGRALHRRGLAGEPDLCPRPIPLIPARAAGDDRRPAGRAVLQPPEGPRPRADRRPGRTVADRGPGRRAGRLHGHRRGRLEPRPGDRLRHLGGAPRRRWACRSGWRCRSPPTGDGSPAATTVPGIPRCDYSASAAGATGTTSSPGWPRRSTSPTPSRPDRRFAVRRGSPARPTARADSRRPGFSLTPLRSGRSGRTVPAEA